MIKGRPIGWLIFGWIGSCLAGSTAGHLIRGHYIWEESPTRSIVATVITLIIITAGWWWLWRPNNEHNTD